MQGRYESTPVGVGPHFVQGEPVEEGLPRKTSTRFQTYWATNMERLSCGLSNKYLPAVVNIRTYEPSGTKLV